MGCSGTVRWNRGVQWHSEMEPWGAVALSWTSFLTTSHEESHFKTAHVVAHEVTRAVNYVAIMLPPVS